MQDYNTVFGSTPAPAYNQPGDRSARKSAVPLRKNIRKVNMEESFVSSGNYYSRAQVSELFPLIPKIVPNSLWITAMINISLDQVLKSSKPLLLEQINPDEKITVYCLFRWCLQFRIIGTEGCYGALIAYW